MSRALGSIAAALGSILLDVVQKKTSLDPHVAGRISGTDVDLVERGIIIRLREIWIMQQVRAFEKPLLRLVSWTRFNRNLPFYSSTIGSPNACERVTLMECHGRKLSAAVYTANPPGNP
ncbi:hypothetical protein F4775DRAFT_591556 [Biscogniauxia sp. FL1348]|nr:hypothetical protein F4775DRAFT_591556 [Biscogniauxia sp. FL1348]